ncbi:hypothetical protein [Ruminococcus sp. HUN007]|uniref:hypothetical protein n=1 Tax=Ruminococcus sp. HUN007 TaxID=1514668 RepID=UPI0005D15695|nr:hypothetical protein [Ruminococcus sp. HUN007]
MKAERLRDAIWKIDDKFIKEAEIYVPKKRSGNTIWIITSASAAVIALCTCIHYHNAVNKALRPEIDNTVAIVTTVTETELYETDVLKTEKPVQASDTVRENTEVTETETGYESSISYAETVPAKTEASSENGGSSGEKTALTERQNEETKVPETEPAVVTREVHTVVPVTEPAVTDKPAETEMTYLTNPQGTAIAMTENIITEPQFIPNPAGVQVTTTEYKPVPVPEWENEEKTETVTQVSADVTVMCETEHSEVSLEDFPQYLIDPDGVYYKRAEIIPSDKIGRLITLEVMKDVYGNTYTVEVYYLKNFYGDTIRVMYFNTKNCFVSYTTSENN